MNKPRKWWLAGLMSLVMPGLGQIYNGQLNKGIFFILLGYCYIPLIYFIVFYKLSVVTLILFWIIAVFYYFFVVGDSIVIAKKNSAEYHLKGYNKILAYIAVVIILGCTSHFYREYIKSNVMEAFKFPSGSMMPTLLVGDHLIADRSSQARNPKHGEVVVFINPHDAEKNFLKRVVAIAGDTVELRNAVLYINGNAVNEPYIRKIDSNSRLGSSVNFGPVVVPADSYFVLGDNRDNSQDSRHFGFVSHDKIKGTARSIYWSWDAANASVRWKRIGMSIQSSSK